jgi:dienelactone hydrolase
MKLPILLLVFCAATKVWADPAVPTVTESRRARFAYDAKADAVLEERAVEKHDTCNVRDITYRGAPGTGLERVNAYLVLPTNQPVRAAILWVHWLGEPSTTNRTQFLEEAKSLAAKGVASVLPDAMWSFPHWYEKRVLDEDDENSAAQVVALRRAIALLRNQGGGQAPLAIVGHDYGGMYASIAAAVDEPAKTCVFIACTPSLLDWAFFAKKPEKMEQYVETNRDFEPIEYVSALQGASVLMQFAENDRYVPLAKAQDFFKAARGRKQMNVYGGANHSMVAPEQIRADRTAWLVKELGL